MPHVGWPLSPQISNAKAEGDSSPRQTRTPSSRSPACYRSKVSHILYKNLALAPKGGPCPCPLSSPLSMFTLLRSPYLWRRWRGCGMLPERRAGETEARHRVAFTLDTCLPILGADVYSFREERHMLEAFGQFLVACDPDVVSARLGPHAVVPTVGRVDSREVKCALAYRPLSLARSLGVQYGV